MFYLPVWRDMVRRLATNPVVIRSSPATDIFAVYCWLISPNIYVVNIVHSINIFILFAFFDNDSIWHD